MIRAYDDQGNVVDLVEHDKKVRADVIDDYTDWLRKTHANFDEELKLLEEAEKKIKSRIDN